MPNQWDIIKMKALTHHVNVARAAFIELGSNVTIDTPVDSGMLRNHWFSAIGSPSTDVDRPANVGGSDSLVQLNAVAKDLKTGLVAYFTNPLPYAPRIEYEGWSTEKAPSGMLRINTAKWSQIVERKEKELAK